MNGLDEAGVRSGNAVGRLDAMQQLMTVLRLDGVNLDVPGHYTRALWGQAIDDVFEAGKALQHEIDAMDSTASAQPAWMVIA